jgi:hypothetical protein
MYQDEQTGHMHFTRDDLLDDLERLKNFYMIFGKEKIINWILDKPTISFQTDKKENIENVTETSTPIENMPSDA